MLWIKKYNAFCILNILISYLKKIYYKQNFKIIFLAVKTKLKMF